MSRMTWKKRPRETGLRSVGCGPYRASVLHDGKREYATVSPIGGNWQRPFAGWMWSCGSNEEIGVAHFNSYPTLWDNEKDAKAHARAYIEKCIKENGK